MSAPDSCKMKDSTTSCVKNLLGEQAVALPMTTFLKNYIQRLKVTQVNHRHNTKRFKTAL